MQTHHEGIFSIPHGHESQLGDDFDVSRVFFNQDTRMAVRQSDSVGKNIKFQILRQYNCKIKKKKTLSLFLSGLKVAYSCPFTLTEPSESSTTVPSSFRVILLISGSPSTTCRLSWMLKSSQLPEHCDVRMQLHVDWSWKKSPSQVLKLKLPQVLQTRSL